MAKTQRMCPNEHCPKFGEATGLMGGCDCGTALVPYRTADQIISDALWEVTPPHIKRMVTYAILGRNAR
jgi:hypothetical protein